MTSAEFQEFYKKNKIAVIGVPVIAVIVLFNQFVLKPAREAKKAPATQVAGASVATTPDAAGGVPGAAGDAAPVGPPPPITVSMATIPPLNTAVESRFVATERFPYGATKNVFEPFYKSDDLPAPIAAPSEEVAAPTVVERPDISYHGFFTVGIDKVAILKLADRLTLTRVGQKLCETALVLETVQPDHVTIRDAEKTGTDQSEARRSFDVALFEGLSGAIPGSGR